MRNDGQARGVVGLGQGQGLLLALAAGLVFAACGSHRPSSQKTPATPRPAASSEVSELAAEYRALRRQRGHWSGGEFNKDTDAWGGRLHEVLARLGELLGKPSRSCADIKRTLGEPDAVQDECGREHLVYFWRGWHDYLYFVCEDGKVVEAKWYFAYE